jgi:hypothetical protein
VVNERILNSNFLGTFTKSEIEFLNFKKYLERMEKVFLKKKYH